MVKPVNDLHAQLMQHLEDYTDEVREVIESSAKKWAREGVKKLKKTGPLETGEYRKNWRLSKVDNAYVIWNKKHYLPHLLEKDHATPDGTGRVKGSPHILPVEREITKKFFNDVIEVVSK